MQGSTDLELSEGSELDNFHSPEVGETTPRAKITSFTDDDSVGEYEEQEDSEEDSEEDWEDTEEELAEEILEGEGMRDVDVPEGKAVVEMPKVSQEYESIETGVNERGKEDGDSETNEYPALAVSEENFEVEGNDYIPKPYNDAKEAHQKEEEGGEEEDEEGSVEERESTDDFHDTASVYSNALSFRAGSTVNGVDFDESDKEDEDGGNSPTGKILGERVTERLVSLTVRSTDRVQGVRFDDEELEEEEDEEGEAEMDAEDDGSQHENEVGVGTEILQEERKGAAERKTLSPESEKFSVEQPALDNREVVDSPAVGDVQDDASGGAAVSEVTSKQSLSLDHRWSSEGLKAKDEDATDVDIHRQSDSNASVDSKRRFSEESEAMSYYYDSDNDDDLRPPGCFAVCHVVVDVMKKMGVKKVI